MSSAVTTATSWQEAWLARAETRAAHPAARLAAESFERFLAKGFPTTRDEEWKYTSVAPIVRAGFGSDAASVARATLPVLGDDVLLSGLAGSRLVFVNGRLESSLSSVGEESSIRIGSLAAALAEGGEPATANFNTVARARATAFGELNTAFFADGAFVHVGRGAVVQAPIHVVHLSVANAGAATATHPRMLIVLEDGAQASVIETQVGEGDACFSNAVTEIILGIGATLDHVHVQRQPGTAFHVAATAVRVGRDATLRSGVFSLGAALSRHDLNIELAGQGASCEMDGLWFLSGSQHCDHHTLVDHAVPHTTSQQLYKGVHADRSQGVFNGKVIVRPGAQKTVAHQQNKNLLLSRDALVDTKPELQISADDVRCTHGATIGQIDDAQIFYLRSRGIDEDEARRLVTAAFAAEIVERVRAPALREELERQLVLRHARLEPRT